MTKETPKGKTLGTICRSKRKKGECDILRILFSDTIYWSFL